MDWRTFLRYATAAPGFIFNPRLALPSTSFLRLAMTDLSDQPKAETFRLSDGHELAFRRYGAEPSDTALILIHGSAGHGGQFHALARALTAHHRVDVYALDMRGHGLSAARRGHGIDGPDRLRADLEEFVIALGAQYRSLVLGGHSAGGGLMSRAITGGLDPRLSAYMFFSPYLGLGSNTVRPAFGGWVHIRLGRMVALFLANLCGIKAFNDETVLTFDLSACPDIWRYTQEWSFNMLLAFGPGIATSKALPIAADKPVLALVGSKDQCFFPHAYREAFTQLAPQTDLQMVDNCGHWDILIAPETIDLVSDWLARLPKAANADTTKAQPVRRIVS